MTTIVQLRMFELVKREKLARVHGRVGEKKMNSALVALCEKEKRWEFFLTSARNLVVLEKNLLFIFIITKEAEINPSYSV